METMLYIIDPATFDGFALNTMPHVHKDAKNGQYILNSTYVHYTRETFAEYNKKHGGGLVALTWDEFFPIYDQYNKNKYCKSWREVTEEQYYDALECLPPCKWHDVSPRFNSFYMSEAYTADLHSFYVKDRQTCKFYSATRSRFITDEQLLEEINQI